MKYFSVLFVLLVWLVALPASAEEIASYTTSLSLEVDGQLRVVEEIVYDFGTLQRHGIYREIPRGLPDTPSSWLFERTISIDNLVVARDGQPELYDVSLTKDVVKVKIGNPDVTVTGRAVYTISYTVTGALVRYVDGTTGLYWNAVGTGWSVPIRASEVTLRAAPGALVGDAKCYARRSCEVGVGPDYRTFSTAGPLTFEQRVADTVVTYQPTERFRVSVLGFVGYAGVLLFALFAATRYRNAYQTKRHKTDVVEYAPYPGISALLTA